MAVPLQDCSGASGPQTGDYVIFGFRVLWSEQQPQMFRLRFAALLMTISIGIEACYRFLALSSFEPLG